MSLEDVARLLAEAGEFTPLDERLAKEPRNDIGNARRLIARFGDDLMMIDEVGWHAWTGTHWSADDGEARAALAAQETAEAIRLEAAALSEAGPRDGESDKEYADRVGTHWKWATASGNRAKLVGLLEAASPKLRRAVADLNDDPLAFNCANATLRLGRDASVERADHSRADRMTLISPVDYDPDADCPKWHAFLARILPDADVRAFIQRFFGYTLTGLTDEEVLTLFYGMGANGKSVLVETLLWVMGGYSMSLPVASLMQDDRRRGSEATPDLARLPSRRLVAAGEPEAAQRLSEGLVKHLTGGDTLTVRHLNHDFFDFLPEFKIVISTNKKPVVRGQDNGIWRRLILVPFEVTIPPDERKPKAVILEEFRAEAPGILNWLLDGFRLWAEGGLAIPDRVRAATESYRGESDPVGNFLAAATAAAPDALAPARDLFEAFCRWAEANAVRPWSQTAFGRAMTDRGFNRVKVGTFAYEGLKIVRDFRDGAPVGDAPDGTAPAEARPDGLPPIGDWSYDE